jgi:hypothetical protein
VLLLALAFGNSRHVLLVPRPGALPSRNACRRPQRGS